MHPPQPVCIYTYIKPNNMIYALTRVVAYSSNTTDGRHVDTNKAAVLAVRVRNFGSLRKAHKENGALGSSRHTIKMTVKKKKDNRNPSAYPINNQPTMRPLAPLYQAVADPFLAHVVDGLLVDQPATV